MLMGGTTLTVTGAEALRNDTYIARFDGTTQFLFEMKYPTMYVSTLPIPEKKIIEQIATFSGERVLYQMETLW